MMKTIRCRGADALARETVKLVRGPNVAISGGSTFTNLFPTWAGRAALEQIAFFPADERIVPIDHPASNWGQAGRLLLEPLGRLSDIENFASSAEHYRALLFKKIGNPVVFDTVFLGMGDDGHTVSLFPASAELDDHEAQVLETVSPKPPRRRVTLGLATLWAAKSLVAVVTGENKRQLVRRLLSNDPTLPITVALGRHPSPILVLESSADPIEGQL